MMPKRKKTTISDKLVMVKSVRRTRSRRMKFCVQRGLGGIPQQAAPGSRGYPGALLASPSRPYLAILQSMILCAFYCTY